MNTLIYFFIKRRSFWKWFVPQSFMCWKLGCHCGSDKEVEPLTGAPQYNVINSWGIIVMSGLMLSWWRWSNLVGLNSFPWKWIVIRNPGNSLEFLIISVHAILMSTTKKPSTEPSRCQAMILIFHKLS